MTSSIRFRVEEEMNGDNSEAFELAEVTVVEHQMRN